MYLEPSNKSLIKRIDFEGYQVKIAANIYPPWFYGYSFENNTFVPHSGRAYSFLLFMADYFNFTWLIINQNDDWGLNPLPNGTYKGMIGSIVSGETDFALGGVSIRFQTNKPFLRFSDEVKSTRITYMTLNSEPIDFGASIFKPFGLNIWLSLLFFILTMLTIGFIVTKIGKLRFDLHWIMLCSFLQRGYGCSSIKGFSMNLLIQLCWWSGLIVLASYSTFIISSLTDVHRKKNIQDLDQFVQMIRERRVVPLVSGQNTYYGLFSRNKDTNNVYSVLADYSITVPSYKAAISQMIRSRLQRRNGLNTPIYAIIAPYDYLDLWADRLGVENFFYRDNIATSFFTDRYALMFRSDSTWINYFNGCILVAREHGFFDRWHRIKYRLPFSVDEMEEMLLQLGIEDLNMDEQELQSLTIHNMEEFFIIFLCLMSFNITILIIEIVWKISQRFYFRSKLHKTVRQQKQPEPIFLKQSQITTSTNYQSYFIFR